MDTSRTPQLRTIRLSACLALLLSSATPAPALSISDQHAREIALRWLTLVDVGNYGDAYEQQPPRIRAGKMKEQFVRWMLVRRTPLGYARSRTFLRVVHTHQLIGAPDGDYQKILFKTSFEHRALALEFVVLTSETGSWHVSGYALR
ncbi:MAG: DUF4019 domain-containing protein [Verrucomicrobia bacterium]|nr:DUF4019 domain-containing protein [Verrucomicrobiota bacterium]